MSKKKNKPINKFEDDLKKLAKYEPDVGKQICKSIKIKTMQERLDNAALDAGISRCLAESIIVTEHALNNMYEKGELSTMNVNFPDDVHNKVVKISNILKVSVGAVLCTLLEEQLKKYPE